MKKVVVTILLAIVCINIYTYIGKRNIDLLKTELMLTNIEVLANSEGSGTSSGSVVCYNTYNSCWFWNCEHIWRCSGLECCDVKCDSKSDQGRCNR